MLTLRLEVDRIDLDLTIGGVTVPPPLPLEYCELRWLAIAAAPAVLAAADPHGRLSTTARRPWPSRSNGAAPAADAAVEGRGG